MSINCSVVLAYRVKEANPLTGLSSRSITVCTFFTSVLKYNVLCAPRQFIAEGCICTEYVLMRKKGIPGPKYKRRSGIYLITCTTTGDTYIGKSKNLHQRYCQHSHDLRRGVHPNPHLQALYASYGSDCLTMTVLELVDDVNSLETSEVAWIKELTPTLNVVNTRLSEKDVEVIRASTESVEALANQYSTTPEYIKQILRGGRW